jgi:hypothetical protein
VLILLCVEQVLRKLRFARQKAETFGLGNGWPEPSSSADRTVAPIRTLREIEVGFELDGATMATTTVCLLHLRPLV